MPHGRSAPFTARLLGLLERYTKTDVRYLFSGGMWLTLDQVFGALIAFLLAIAFAHFVPKETYGTYRYILSLFWLLTALTLTGLPAALSQAVARGNEGVLRTAMIPSLLWSMPLSLIASGLGLYYFMHENGTLAMALLFVAVLGPMMQPSSLFSSYLAGKKEFRAYTLFGLIVALAPAIALLIVMPVSVSPVVFLIAYLGGTIAAGALCTVLTFRFWKPNRKMESGLYALSRHFSMMNLLSTAAQQIDKLLVFHFLGAVELAVYIFATSIPEQVKGLFNSITTLALPKFVLRPFAEVRANFWYRLCLLSIGLIGATTCYMLIAPFVFRIFFPAYTEAVWYSQLYALSLVFIGNALPVTLLQAKEAKRELYIYNMLSPIFQIATLFIFTISWGLAGAVLSRVAGRAFNLVVGGALLEYYARSERSRSRNGN